MSRQRYRIIKINIASGLLIFYTGLRNEVNYDVIGTLRRKCQMLFPVCVSVVFVFDLESSIS